MTADTAGPGLGVGGGGGGGGGLRTGWLVLLLPMGEVWRGWWWEGG